MIERDHLQGRIEQGIEQGGHQPERLATARHLWVRDGVLEHAHRQQMTGAVFAVAGDLGQIGLIGAKLLPSANRVSRHTSFLRL
jgi:hypothetical protein